MSDFRVEHVTTGAIVSGAKPAPSPACESHVLVSPAALTAALAFVSDDATRPALNGVLVEPDGSVTATDGRVMLTVRPAADLNAADYPLVPGAERFHAPVKGGTIIPTDAVKAAVASARKFRKAHGLLPGLAGVRVAVNEKSAELTSTDLDSTARAEYRPLEGPFPNYSQVIPKGVPERTIHVNARLLGEALLAIAPLAENADGYGRNNAVAIEIRGPLQAIVIRPLNGSAAALVMPLRGPEA